MYDSPYRLIVDGGRLAQVADLTKTNLIDFLLEVVVGFGPQKRVDIDQNGGIVLQGGSRLGNGGRFECSECLGPSDLGNDDDRGDRQQWQRRSQDWIGSLFIEKSLCQKGASKT